MRRLKLESARHTDEAGEDASRKVEPPTLDKRAEATRFRVEDLLGLVLEGRIRVPDFQRKWQWDKADVASFFDSLYRGYPVGTLLFWKRRGEEATVHLGPRPFTVPARDDALWVVDGQQRITALAGVLIPNRESELQPVFDLYFDLVNQVFTRPVHHRPPAADWAPMGVVVDAEDLFAWLDEYRRHAPPKERVQLAVRLGKLIREYEIPAYVVDTDDERVLRHVFHRVNTSGKPLGEVDVFDALHGAQGETQPGELRDVAARLGETGFGGFETDVLLRSLRSLLGQDVGDTRLPDGTDGREALARTERALRRVVEFFRRDARIPHLRLLPYEMTLVTLAVLFDQHPDPSARSRQLLARWIWRGAITGSHRGDSFSLRSTLALIQGQKESAAVTALLHALPRRPDAARSLGRFHFHSARSKLETLALVALEPKNLATGRAITMTELFEANDHGRREVFPRLIHPGGEVTAAVEAELHTVANHIVHPWLPGAKLRQVLEGELGDDVLKSHAISRAEHEKLCGGDAAGFLCDRRDRLAKHIERFLDSRAAWEQSDRPALQSLIVSDD